MRHYLFHHHSSSSGAVPDAAAKPHNRPKKAGWSWSLLLVLTVILYAAQGLQQSYAVVPYRSADDYGPSLQARSHLPACRRAAIEAMAGMGKIESESFVQRNDAEYFRFVMRHGTREVLIICDGHAGVIRRQIDIWGDL